MSETNADTTKAAFVALTDAFKAQIMADINAPTFANTIEYFKAVDKLRENYMANLPVSGVVPGKRGRKPKDAAGAAAAEPVAGAEAPLTDTQVEVAAPTRGRGRAVNE